MGFAFSEHKHLIENLFMFYPLMMRIVDSGPILILSSYQLVVAHSMANVKAYNSD